MLSIPACHAGDRGSIPRQRGYFFCLFGNLIDFRNCCLFFLSRNSKTIRMIPHIFVAFSEKLNFTSTVKNEIEGALLHSSKYVLLPDLIITYFFLVCLTFPIRIKKKLRTILEVFWNYQISNKKIILSVGELNPGLPRDRRGYLPLY